MKKIMIALFCMILLSVVVIADEWICNYEEGVTRTFDKSKYTQCPPVLKEFYRLQDQNDIVPSGGGAPGGGSYIQWGGASSGGSASGPLKVIEEYPEQTNKLTISQKIALLYLILLPLTMLALHLIKRGIKQIKDEYKKHNS